MAFRPDRVVEITIGARLRRYMLVAMGRGQLCAFLRDQEARGIASAFDI
jgi:hypothetical protein